MKTTFIPLLLAVLTLSACIKEDGTENAVYAECRLLQNYRFEKGQVVDSFRYQYDEQGRIKAVLGKAYSFRLEYQNEKVVRRNFMLPAATENFAHEIVHYHANGNIDKIERFAGGASPIRTVLFTYYDKKLTRITYLDEHRKLNAKYDYSYTINNITGINGQEYWNGTNRFFNYKFTYDTEHNKTHVGQQWMLKDGFVDFLVGLAAPYVLSDNHVKSVEESGVVVPVQYSFDQNKNVTAIKLGNEPTMKADYQCR